LLEDNVKKYLCKWLTGQGYKVFVKVVHNMMSGEKVIYGFKPDIDILAINTDVEEIVGIETKGVRKGRYGKRKVPSFHEALGEALMYLINPVSLGVKIRYEKGNRVKYQPIHGGIFDKVYICYPSIKDVENAAMLKLDDLLELLNITPIGLITISEGVIHEAKLNPILNQDAKEVFIEISNQYILGRYKYT